MLIVGRQINRRLRHHIDEAGESAASLLSRASALKANGISSQRAAMPSIWRSSASSTVVISEEAFARVLIDESWYGTKIK